MPKLVNLIGLTFGELKVVGLSGGSRGGSRLWKCVCSCGKECEYSTRHLNRKNNNVRSCGCKQHKSGKESVHFKGYEGISSNFFINHVKKSANRYIKKGRFLEFNIDEKYLWEIYVKQNKKCAYTGIDLHLPETASDKQYNASVDRIDSSKGYIKGNVQFVHKHINIMKNIFSNDYFLNMCKKVTEYESKN